VAGVHHQVRVAADGTTLVLTDRPRAGILHPDDLARLRRLLASDELAREARSRPRITHQCADGFVYTVTAGRLRISRASCGEATDAPTFARVVALLRKPTLEPFPPPPAGPPLPTATIERSGGDAGSRDTLSIRPDGNTIVLRSSGAPQPRRATTEDADLLRALLAEPLRPGVRWEYCADGHRYQVLVAGRAPVELSSCRGVRPPDEVAGALISVVDELIGR